MLKDLSYKKKNTLLLAAIAFGLLCVYVLAFKKTIGLVAEVNATETKIEAAKDAPARSAFLQKEIEKLDATIGTQNRPDENSQQSLLELVTDYCKSNNAVLREFPVVTQELKGSFVVETNRFVVEGNFSTLLALVYTLEQKNTPGKIASVEYALKKDAKTREMALTATIYLQNIKKQ